MEGEGREGEREGERRQGEALNRCGIHQQSQLPRGRSKDCLSRDEDQTGQTIKPHSKVKRKLNLTYIHILTRKYHKTKYCPYNQSA